MEIFLLKFMNHEYKSPHPCNVEFRAIVIQ